MLPSIKWLDNKLSEVQQMTDDGTIRAAREKIITDVRAYSEEDWNSLALTVEEKDDQDWNLALIPILQNVICQEAFLQLSVLSQSENPHVKKAASDAIVGYAGFSNGKYRHYKGNNYEVIGVGRNTENKDWMIVYRSIEEPDKIWIRPASMWLEIVRDGLHRFERIG